VSSDQPDDSRLADKLNLLFDTVHPADRGPYSNKEVAAAVRERGGSISDVYIWQLRTGRKSNPTKEHLEALAGFFDIEPGFFFDRRESAEIERDLRAVKAMQNLKVRKVAARMSGLSDANLEAVGTILEQIIQALEAQGRPDLGSRRPPQV